MSMTYNQFQDCTGGAATFFMAANAYIADITSTETRTKRMAFLAGLWPVSSNIGKALSGLIKTHLGITYNFIFGMILSLMSVFYVLFFVPDSKHLIRKRLEEMGETAQENRTSGKDPLDSTYKYIKCGESFSHLGCL